MTDTTPTPAPTAPTPVPAPSTPTPNRRQNGLLGCLGRFISALLVIIITTAIAVGVVAYAAFTLGYTPQTPSVLGAAEQRVATLEVENSSLKSQNELFQTQIAQISRQSGTNGEQLDDLQQQVEGYAKIGDTVATQMATDSRERATLIADIHSSRDSVTLFATAEASRAGLLDDLRRRSDRVERFLARLSDISQDTALDLSSGTPTVLPTAVPVSPTLLLTATPSPIATATILVSPTPSPTIDPTVVLTPSPTAARATKTAIVSPTVIPTATRKP